MKRKSAGPPPKFEEKDKIAIATQYFAGGVSYKELADKYGFDRVTIIHFVRWYKKHYLQASHQIVKHSKPAPAKALPLPGDTAAMQKPARQTDKDKQLKAAHLKIAALEMLIANGKKELGIDLVKKSGTKPSGK